MLLPSLLGYARLYRVLMSTAWFAVIKAHFTRNLHSSADLALVLLRARRERPCGRAAEERDERAPPHSITSSARASSVGGISRPSALAVVRLMTKSNLVGCSTGRLAGFAPFRIRPVYNPT